MNIEKPYFADSELNGRTDNYATVDEAIRAACEAQLAPFTVYQIVAQPIALRLSNMNLPQSRNGVHL